MMNYDNTNYSNSISKKITNIKPSGIRKFFDIALSMTGVIALGVGEPDFQTPWAIRKTAITALEKGKTIYSANAGHIELRKVISSYTLRKIGLEYNPFNEIIVTVGGSEAIDLAIRSMLNPLDEVLIPQPSFVCYAPLVEMAGGVAVPIETKLEDNFILTAQALREKITPRTKILVMPFPNNPTGAIMTKEELEPIADIIRNTNIIVLSDEIYAELTYGCKHFSIASLPDMQTRTIIVNGFSKTFAMTGWRLGYTMGPYPIIEQMLKLHQYGIMCSPTISQHAAVTALNECDDEVERMVNEYNMRRRYLVNAFNKLGLTCFEPKGAFYVFPCIKSTGLSSEDFCNKLVTENKVAVVPGNAFGECGEGYVRVSYAYSLHHLMEAIGRIEIFMKNLNQ